MKEESRSKNKFKILRLMLSIFLIMMLCLTHSVNAYAQDTENEVQDAASENTDSIDSEDSTEDGSVTEGEAEGTGGEDQEIQTEETEEGETEEDVVLEEAVAPEGSTEIIEHTKDDTTNLIPEEDIPTFENDPILVETEDDAFEGMPDGAPEEDSEDETEDTGDSASKDSENAGSGNTDSENNDNEIADNGEAAENEETEEETPEDAIDPEVLKNPQNAIQKAIDEALKMVEAESRSITIKVSSGEYKGDLTISKDNTNGNVSEDFILYILAEDSYQEPADGQELIDKTSIHSSAMGTAMLNGNISIDGIHVVLAGLYWSLENTATVKDATLTVNGTQQGDTVNIELKENSEVRVDTGSGEDEISVSSTEKNGTPEQNEIIIHAGSGDDRVNVDVSVANQASDIEINGGEGTDRIHFTGTLKENGEGSSAQLSDGNAQISLLNSNNKKLAFKILNNEQYTDELENKIQKKVKAEELHNNTYEAYDIFTDYICEEDGDLTIENSKVLGNGFLTNLIIKCVDTLRLKDFIIDGLNLILKAQNIIFGGMIEAQSIMAEASDSDAIVRIKIEGLDKIGMANEQVDLGSDITSLSAKITVEEDAIIKTKDSMELKASTSQTASLLPEGQGYNFLSVKVADAIIDILGKIETDGSFSAASSVYVKASASNTSLAMWYIPLGVAIAVTESKVNLGKNAIIKAAGDVVMIATTEITFSNIATMGTLPISLALSVVTADTLVDVQGDITSQTGIVNLQATGKVNLKTVAAEKSSATTNVTANPTQSPVVVPGSGTGNPVIQTGSSGMTGGSKSGGFFAVAVSLQDVSVKVRDDANIIAGKDVVILSEAEERIITTATSGDGSSSSDAMDLTSIVDIVMLLINTAQTKLTTHLQRDKALDGAAQQVQGTDGYEVRSSATTGGSVNVPSKSKPGDVVTVRIVPQTNYKLTALTYTYLLAGESAPRTGNINISGGGNTFTFVMPAGHVNVIPVFVKDTSSGSGSGSSGSQDDQDYGLGDLFGEDDDDDSLGLAGLFNEGTSGATESANTTTSTTSSGTSTAPTHTITVGTLTNGALIPASTSAAEGTEVAITVNPAAGYQLKEGTLKASVALAGRTTIQTLAKNAAGKYILNMPAGNVTLTAEFVQAPTTGTGTSSGSGSSTANSAKSQVVGALAVAVVTNDNEAVIDTTGTIRAGGVVNVNAKGVTQSTVLADGSPIQAPTTTGGTGSGTGAGSSSTYRPQGDSITQPQKKTYTTTVTNTDGTTTTKTYEVQTGVTVNGRIEFKTDSTPVFGAAGDTGYQLKAGTLKYSYTKDGKTFTGELRSTGGGYMLPSHETNADGSQGAAIDWTTVTGITITAEFEEVLHNITINVDTAYTTAVSVRPTAHEGEEITVTVKTPEGTRLTSLTYNGTVINAVNGVYKFSMPNADVIVDADFANKTMQIVVEETAKQYITVSDAKADGGEKVKLTLTDAAKQAGKNVVSAKAVIVYDDILGTGQTDVETITIDTNTMEFVVPDDGYTQANSIRIEVTFADKAYDITVGPTVNGTVTAPVKADAGETITIVVNPTAGFRLKANSLTAKVSQGTTDTITPIAANASGAYTFTLPTPTGSAATMSVLLSAIFEKDPAYSGKAKLKKSTMGIGVGVNVTVTNHTNHAYIKNGTIIANGLEVSAVSGGVSDKVLSSSTSRAGYSQGDIGLGGAISVHVASAKTRAAISNKATIKLKDASALKLKAQSFERFVTSAEAAPTVRTVMGTMGTVTATNPNSGKLGVGAGIAVGVYGSDVVAGIEDGAKIILIDNEEMVTEYAQLSDIEISAHHSATEVMNAKAGSAGGTSISPVLSLTISGGNTSAYLGTGDGLKVKGLVTVSSASDIARELTANASAAGGDVGVGGSFAISVLNDSSRANIRRTIKAGNNVKVSSSSKSTLKLVSRASANGSASRQSSTSSQSGTSGTAGTGSSGTTSESDRQANASIAGASSLASGVGTTNVSSGTVSNLTANRQLAQTSEGDIQIAAGFALNVMKNISEAYLDKGITIEAKNVDVYSEALTGADLLANASATESAYGVGVAVAINVVNYENIARVNSGVIAENLYVQATIIEETESDDDDLSQPTSIIEKVVEEAVRKSVEEMVESMDLLSVLGKEALTEFIASSVSDLAGKSVQALLNGTGLQGFIAPNIETKVDTFLETFETKVGDSIRNWMMQLVLQEVQNLILNGLPTGSQIVNPVSPVYPEENQKTGTLTTAQKERIQSAAGGLAQELFGDFINVSQLMAFFKGNIAEQLKTKALAAAKEAGKAIPTAALDALSTYLNLEIEEEDPSSKNTFVTQTVSGAGASSVGVAGSVAIAVINGTTKAYIADADETLYPINVEGDVVITALSRQKEKAVATSAVDADGNPDLNNAAGNFSDIGDGNSDGTLHPSLTDNDIIVTPMRNGTVSISGSQYAGGTITLTPEADEGFKLTEGSITVTRTDTNKIIQVTKGDDGSFTFVIPEDFTANGDYDFSIKAEFERIVNTISIGTITTVESNGQSIPGGSTITGQMNKILVRSDSDPSGTTAGLDDKVYVTVQPADGYILDTLIYKYMNGTTEQIASITTVEDAVQKIYSFMMPDKAVTILPTFRVMTAQELAAQGLGGISVPQNSAGMSVGVGASFAFNKVDMTVEAYTERDVHAGSFDVRADGVHYIDTYAVAGSDPLAQAGTPSTGGGTGSGSGSSSGGTTGGTTGSTSTPIVSETMDVALDAAVGLGIVNNIIRAYVPDGVVIITVGGNTIDVEGNNISNPKTDEEKENAEAAKADDVNMNISASLTGKSTTKASGFTVGQATAVGAAVAVDIADSNVNAEFAGTGEITGKARVKASAFNKDDSISVATAMGADLDRYLSIFNTAKGNVEKTTNDIVNANYVPENLKTTNNSNQTASTINSSLGGTQGAGGQPAQNALPLSQNVVRGQGVSAVGTPTTAQNAAAGAASGAGGVTVTPVQTDTGSLQVAAAVSANLTTHRAIAEVSGNLTAENLDVISENKANFRTLATGAAMSLAEKSSSIAAAAAVLVSKNKAEALIADDVEIKTTGDVNVKADQTQNMDGGYRGWLGAQAIAGSVAGSGGASVAGAFAIIVSSADTLASVGKNTKLTAEDILVRATDKSKLAVRAGGVSLSTGAAVGLGASFGLIYTYNTVKALVDEDAQIHARSLDVSAAKRKVDFSDYQMNFDLSMLLTDSTGKTVTAAEKGLIDINKTSTGYKITINASTEKLLETIDLLNFLSSTNYYTEAIAGTVSVSPEGILSAAGSMAMLFFYNTTEAEIADGVQIILTAKEADGSDAYLANLYLNATADTTARIISGALSVSSASAGVGVTVGAMENEDQIRTKVGDNVIIIVDGNYEQVSEQISDYLVVTAAAVLNEGGVGVGGAVNTLLMDSKVEAIVGEGGTTIITAGKNVFVEALSDQFMMHLAVSASAASGHAAAGGTLAVIVTDSDTLAVITDNTVVTSKDGMISVYAYTKEKMITGLGSASASTGTVGAAGAVNVFISGSDTTAQIGNKAVLTAKDDIEVYADGETTMLVISAALTAASTAAIGATVTVNVFEREVHAIVGEYAVLTSENGNISVQAMAKDMTLVAALAAGASSNMALTGTIPVIIGESVTAAEVQQQAILNAGDSIGVIANLDSDQYFIAGGLGVSGTAGAGATVSTVVQSNTVNALVSNDVKLTSGGIGTGITVPNRGGKRRGIIIHADAKEKIIMASVAAGLAGTTAVNGVVNTLVVENKVDASVGEGAELTANGAEEYRSDDDEDYHSGDIVIEADDDTMIINLAGSVSAAGTIGAGATVVTLVFAKNVKASVAASTVLTANGSIIVTANTIDDLYLLAIAFGAAGTAGAAGGVNVLVFENHAEAILGGSVSAGRDVIVAANTDSLLVNAALAVGAGGTAGVTAIAIVTYFYNETIAYVRENAGITAGGDICVKANSKELVTADAAGAAAGGTAGVGGTADIVITKVVTKAYTESAVTLTGINITIEAVDDYDFVAVTATIAAAGTAGVGVTVLTSVAYNTVTAQIGENNRIRAAENITLKAQSDRNVKIYTGTVGAGGVAGVAGTVAVIVLGSKLNDEAHDGIYVTGTNEEGETLSSMDPQVQTDVAFESAHSRAKGYKPEESLDVLLASDGSSAEDATVDGTNYGQDTTGTETSEANMNEALYDKTADLAEDHKVSGAIIDGEMLKDSTQAIVLSGTTIIAGINFEVNADDNLTTDVIAGTLAAGVAGGAAGVGVAVVIANSNVQAIVNSDVTISVGGDVIVKAQIGAKEQKIESLESEWIKAEDGKQAMNSADINQKVKDDGISDAEKSTIRVIGVTAGVGAYAGIAVSVAVLNVNSVVQAIMGGNIQTIALEDGTILTANNLLVEAVMNYGQVLTTTLGVGGGMVGISGSVAVTMYNGTVEASIAGTANVDNVTGTIKVNSDGTVNAVSVATGLAAGAGALNAGSATVINRTRIDTYIGQGVRINSPNSVLIVSTDFNADGKAYVISAAGGVVAAGASVAIVISELESLTYLGMTPDAEVLEGSVGTGGYIIAKNVNVTNHVNSTTTVNGYGIAGGAAAVNGIVAIGMNRTAGYAAISQMDVDAGHIHVQATMTGDVQVVTTAITGGAVAVGATVAISELKTDNHALIDTTGAKITADSITVWAGTDEDPYDSEALTSVITGTAGAAAVAVNYAKALNRAENIAEIIGDSGKITTGTLDVFAHGKTRAYAFIANAGVGALSVNVSVAQADIGSIQKAQIVTAGEIETIAGKTGNEEADITVTSIQNNETDHVGVFEMLFGKVEGNNGRDEEILKISFNSMAEARIFSAAAAMAAVSANAVTAKANAASIAKVSAAKVTAKGNIRITNRGYSKARAKADNLQFGVVSAAVNVATADAAGKFEAGIGADGEDDSEDSEGDINAANIQITNIYESAADAQTEVGAGAVDAALVKIAANTAFADVTTNAKAYISGTGNITADDINVLTNGTAKSNAIINPAKVSVNYINLAASVVEASLHAIQESYAKGALITADALTIRSLYNVNETEAGYDENGKPKVPSVNTDKGAYAAVGAPVATGSGYSAEASTANAVSDSTVKAYIQGAVTNIAGELTADVFATSYAKAEVLKPTVNVNLASASVVLIESDAKGSYLAYVDTTGSEADNGVAADNIRIAVGYQTKADAITGPGGGKGVSISGVSINVNQAKANASTKAESYVTGNGKLTVDEENLEVLVRGKATADAKITTDKISVSLGKIAANETYATVDAKQSAYMDFDGEAYVKGQIIIDSDYTVSGNGAYATIGTLDGSKGIDVSLVDGAISSSYASSEVINKAYMQGTGIIETEGDVTVLALTDSVARAIANEPINVSFILISGLYAESKTSDVTLSFIGDGEALTLISGGKATVKAEGKTASKATSTAGESAALISGAEGVMKAGIGSKNNKQTVKAYIADHANVTAQYDIVVTAYNEGYVESNISKKLTTSAIDINRSIVPTYSWYLTESYIGSQAVVRSLGGAITVTAKDKATARSKVNGDSVGLVASANNKYAKNEVNQTVAAKILEGAVVEAYGNLTVQADSDADMDAETYAESDGIFSGGKLQSYNTLTRDVDVLVGKNAKLFSDFGTITIQANAGQKDKIITKASGEGAGFIAISEVEAKATVTTNADVTIETGADIQNTFGNINIKALAGCENIQTIGEFDSGGFASTPEARAYVTDIQLNARVNIASENGNTGEPGKIRGKNININSGIGNLYIKNRTYAYTKGMGGSAEAYSHVKLIQNNKIIIDHVILKAYDNLYITADATPTNSGTQIEVYAGTKIAAFAGWIKSEAKLMGSSNASVDIRGNADITGADVRVESKKFNGSVYIKATGNRKAIASKKEIMINEFKDANNKNVTVNAGAVFHIGDAAAGIAIDVYEDEFGNIRIRTVGMPDEVFNAQNNGENITFINDIRNNKAGKLTILGENLSGNVIYGQQYIPEIIITNRTDLNLILAAIDPYNEAFSKAAVNAAGYNKNYLGMSEITNPSIIIENSGSGDVTFGGLVNNERGSVTVRWTDQENSGSAYTNDSLYMGSILIAPVWAHSLIIENAKAIGSEDNRFQVYLAALDGQNTEIIVNTSENAYLQLTLAEITPVTELTKLSDAKIDGTLELTSIAAGGVLDIVLPTAIRMQYLADAGAAAITIPGVLEFTTEELNLGDVVLTLDQLELYRIGVQDAAYSVYELPNGISLYLDAEGKIHRAIASNGTAFNTSDYGYRVENGQLVIELYAYDAELNVATGILTAKGENGLDVYLDYNEELGGWYTAAGQVVQKNEYEIYKVDKDGNRTQVTVGDLYYYKTDSDGNKYYFFHEEARDNQTTWNYDGKYYAIVIDPQGYMVGIFEGKRETYEYEGNKDVTVLYGDWKTVGTDSDGNVIQERTVTYRWRANNFLNTGIAYQVEWIGTETKINGNSSMSNLKKEVSTIDGDYKDLFGDETWEAWSWNYGGFEGMIVEVPELKGDRTEIESFDYTGIWFKTPTMTEVELEGEKYNAYTFGNKDDATYFEVFFAPVNLLQNGNKEYRLDTTNTVLEYEFVEYTYRDEDTNQVYQIATWTIIGNAEIHLERGQSITLKTFLKGERDTYRIFADIMICKTGEIIADMSGAMADQLVYNPQTGRLEMNGLIYNYDQEQKTAEIILYGNQKLEKISDNVAKGSNGEFYYWNGSSWVNAQYTTDSVTGDTTVTYNGVTQIVITEESGITYYIAYEDGSAFVKVGSDHSVEWLREQTEVIAQKEIDGSVYEVSDISGGEVVLEMEDSKGSLVDGDDPANDDADITSDGDITIITESEGSIGTESDMLDIVTEGTEGEINFNTPTEENVITTDTYIYVPEGNMGVEDNTKVEGATLHIVTDNGDIISDVLYAKDANIIFEANGNIYFDMILSEDSDIYLEAEKDILMKDGVYCGEYGTHNIIKFADHDTDENSSLTLKAVGDIGTSENSLIIDLPEEVTTKILLVDDYYLEYLELTDEFLPDGDNVKVNEFFGYDIANEDKPTWGDWLEYIGSDELEILIENQTPEELAAWIMNVKSREEWTSVLDTAVVETILKADINIYTAVTAFVGSTSETLVEELLKAICEKTEIEGSDPVQYQYLMTDEETVKLLAYFIKNADEMDKDLITSFGAFLGSLLTDEEIEVLKKAALKESECPETKQYMDDDPKDANIHIGESTGEGYVYNEGNIIVTQDTGDITVGHIKSEREDVILNAIEGSILASSAAAVKADFTEHILGKNIILTAKENIGSAEQALITEQRDNRPAIVKNIDESRFDKDAVTGDNIYILRQNENGKWILDVTVNFDWIRADYAEEAERLDAEATEGSLFIEEATGDIGIGTIASNGKADLTAAENIVDVRSDEEKALETPNVKADMLDLTAVNGAIGSDEDKILVDIENNASLTAEEDIAVEALDNFTVTTESESGKVYLDVEDNLILTVSSDSAVDPETGNATGDLPDGKLQADSIWIYAEGDIGTAENPLEVNTAASTTGRGSLSVTANTIFVEEVSGDLVLKEIDAKSANADGDSVIIISAGDILAAEEDKLTDAANAQKEANDALDEAEHAQTVADVLKLDVAAKEAELRAAEEVLRKAKENLETTAEELAKAQEEVDLKKIAYDQAAAVWNAADTEAAEKAAEAVAKQQAADIVYEAAKNSDLVITAPGDVTLKSQGSVGTNDDAISTEVQGTVNVTAGEGTDDQVNISSKNELTYGEIEGAEKIRLISMEGIGADGNGENTPVLKTENLILEALDGNLGSKDAPLIIDADTLSGMSMNADTSDDGEAPEGNSYIQTLGDITIGTMDAENTLNLKVDGNVNAKPTTSDSQSNITADELDITADGNIGTENTPLTVNADEITLNGDDINLDAITNLVIDQITGDHIKIHGDGDITGSTENTGNHIIGNQLDITADGNIGDPLRVYIRGTVDAESTYGTVRIINRYRRGGSKEDKAPGCISEYGGFGVKTGDSAEYQMYLMWMLCMVLAIIALRKKKMAH